MITLFKRVVEKIKKTKPPTLFDASEQEQDGDEDGDWKDWEDGDSAFESNTNSDVPFALNDSTDEPHRYPESYTDLTRQRSDTRLSYGSYDLTGNAYSDLTKIVETLQDYSQYACAEESKLLEYELDRMVHSLLDKGRSRPALTPVPAINYLVKLLENSALKDDVEKLKDEVSKLNSENKHYLDQINSYRDGAVSSRTAHTICLQSAEDLYGMVTRLIDTHPDYDGEIELTNKGGGKENNKTALLKDVFGDKRGLAKASVMEILSVPGVGDATLEFIINMFNADNLPSIAGLGNYDFTKIYGHWKYVNRINRESNYKWRLPTPVMGGQFYVSRSRDGYSYLVAKDAELDSPASP